jgi:dTDP-4-amino-4,6-dideoxygalactose transaminase
VVRQIEPTPHIPLFRAQVTAEAINGAVEVLESGWLGQGRKVAEFEEALADYVGARHCVAVSSGTAALHVALRTLGLAEGAEVVTSPIEWVSAHFAVLYERCRPVLADIQPTTGNIDPRQIERQLTPRTAALLIVHHAGYPCDLDEIYEIASRRRLPVIEDCAHAIGAQYRGARIGGTGDMGSLHCFSFGPTKNLTTIHGGAVTTNDSRHLPRLRALRSLGFSRDAFARLQGSSTSYRSSYNLAEPGFRYEMPDVHAAIGLAQLGALDGENRRRARIAERYASHLAETPGVELLHYREDRESAYHMYPVLVDRRDALADKMRRHGVDVGVHYPLNTLLDHDGVPRADRFASRTLTLPLHPSLTDEEIDRTIRAFAGGW